MTSTVASPATAVPARRILMLLQNNPYPQDIRVRREAETLAAAGYVVSVIAPRRRGQSWQEEIAAVTVLRFPRPPEGDGAAAYLLEYGYSLLAIFLLALYASLRDGFDIVHTHNPPDLLVVIAAFFKLFGKRFVYDHHDLAPEMYQALFERQDGALYRILVLLERLSCRLADHVIVTNDSYRAVDLARGRVPEVRLSIVRNGPDPATMRPTEPARGLRQPGRATLLYVGDMGHHDGVDYLLQALVHLREELGDHAFHCYLVGGGDARPALAALAAELALDDHVTFTGRVPHAEVPAYLSAADVCLAPEPSNAYNDRSTMIKILEYMAVARPIVAFDLPEHRRSAGDAASYARRNDPAEFAGCIAALLADPDRAAEMGALGRERVLTTLAWSTQAPHLLAAYRSLTAVQS